jgi:hypothetical protein
MRNTQAKQAVDHHIWNEYEHLTRRVEALHPELIGKFTVRIQTYGVSVKTASYGTYLLCKGALKTMTTKPIEWTTP